MLQISSRATIAPSPNPALRALCTTATLSLTLLVAAHPGHAAVTASVADVLGVWTPDKNDPYSNYSVAAGPTSGTLRIVVPAKAVGRPVGENLTLERIGPGEFATPKGSPIRANFRITEPRHATFRMFQNDKKSFGFGYLLLEKR